MIAKKWMWALAIPFMAGTLAVGCGEEDYSDLESEWSTEEQALAGRLDESQSAYDAMMADLNTASVADDWDTNTRTSYEAAKTRMTEYGARLQEGRQRLDELRAAREAAAKSGKRTDYQTAWDDARNWYTEFGLWLDTFRLNSDIYTNTRSTAGTAGTTTGPYWWQTAFGDGPEDPAMDAKAAEEAAEDADGISDDVNAVKEAGKDVGEGIKEAAKDVAKKAEEITDDDVDGKEQDNN